ncbi:MAG: hypothetical protein EBY51_09780, partial [Actinobacteria bacterium]|nr:hypothetical protein [Actinomycetota bacterium]
MKAIMKRLLIPALLASSAFVLSGCLDVDADLSVNEDATATGEMTIAISSEISGLLGLGSGVDLVDFDFGGYQIDVEMPGPIVSVDGTNVDQTSETSFRIE